MPQSAKHRTAIVGLGFASVCVCVPLSLRLTAAFPCLALPPADEGCEWEEGQAVTGVCYKGSDGADHVAHAHLTVRCRRRPCCCLSSCLCCACAITCGISLCFFVSVVHVCHLCGPVPVPCLTVCMRDRGTDMQPAVVRPGDGLLP
jgi:hypothetical protein